MGIHIDREHFTPEDFARFSGRLDRCLEAFDALLGRPGFGKGPTTVGAELEVFLVGGDGRPRPVGEQVLETAGDSRLASELGRYNLECNLAPQGLAGRPFSAWEAQIASSLAAVRRVAIGKGAEPALVGILPTLRPGDFGPGTMTDEARYRALSWALERRRGGPFQLRISGRECLVAECPDVTLECANTSFQVHLKVDPDRFSDVYNAVQIATAPALAVAGNAPFFLGCRLWDETRVALFKQAVDDRGGGAGPKTGTPRVTYGPLWQQGGAGAFFRHVCEHHPVVLPLCGDEDPVEVSQAGGVPDLDELRLHNGTVWHWNRGVYDPAGGGHVRIEMRALPAGPTPIDMVANGAFLLGLALWLSGDATRWTRALSFESGRSNFYRAAQHGPEAELTWPGGPHDTCRRVRARDLALRLLPRAAEGLGEAGVDPTEVDRLLDVIRGRAESGRTGARWQTRVVDELQRGDDRWGALEGMFRRYRACAGSGEPVHQWPWE